MCIIYSINSILLSSSIFQTRFLIILSYYQSSKDYQYYSIEIHLGSTIFASKERWKKNVYHQNTTGVKSVFTLYFKQKYYFVIQSVFIFVRKSLSHRQRKKGLNFIFLITCMKLTELWLSRLQIIFDKNTWKGIQYTIPITSPLI